MSENQATTTRPPRERNDKEQGRSGGRNRRQNQQAESPYMEKVIRINRVTKVCPKVESV